jgi:hypothetical protein
VDERRFRFRAADCEAILTNLVWLTCMVFPRVKETFFMMLCGLVLKNLCRVPKRVVPRNFRG